MSAVTVADRIVWETCPHCGALAATGWEGGDLLEFDCTVPDCQPSPNELDELRRRGEPAA